MERLIEDPVRRELGWGVLDKQKLPSLGWEQARSKP